MISEDKFTNRELSWLEFNQRVLEEAYEQENPLLERLMFASIVCSNLDEFFMVRVAGLLEKVKNKKKKKDPAGLSPLEQLTRIKKRVDIMLKDLTNCYCHELVPALKREDIYFLKYHHLNQEEKDFIDTYFFKKISPLLTPIVVDFVHPFPLIKNKGLNIGVLIDLKKRDQKRPLLAIIEVPSVINRYIELPTSKEEKKYILIEEIIKSKISNLFPGYQVIAKSCFRICRNSNLKLDDKEENDFLEQIDKSLLQRKKADIVRLEVEKNIDNQILALLKTNLKVVSREIYKLAIPLDLTYLDQLKTLTACSHLRYPVFQAAISPIFKQEDIFEQLKKKDILLHHPYQSFQVVIDLLKKAAKDPNVLAIKQTVYRVSAKSPLMQALITASQQGKRVTVLLELKARFDEKNNILWAKRLKEAGCNVIYGLKGFKTHCKALLIVRQEGKKLKRYVHVATGNYNEITSRVYTDIGLLTADPFIAVDISNLFNMLTSSCSYTPTYKIDIAPFALREKFLNLIEQEIINAKKGKKAYIIVKVNALVDPIIIKKLYQASEAGVKLDLIVRGICCLKAGVKGLSENIRVISIVGRYLEHSRIFYFYDNAAEHIFISSADWMPRNLDKRVELLIPISEQRVKNTLKRSLNIILQDNINARYLNKEGEYLRFIQGEKKINSQLYFNLSLNNKTQETLQQVSKSKSLLAFTNKEKELIEKSGL